MLGGKFPCDELPTPLAKQARIQLSCGALCTAKRLQALVDVCCADVDEEDEGCATTGIPTTCSVKCGAALLLFLDDCADMFEGSNGLATGFATLRETCVSIPLDTLLLRVKQLQAEGCQVDTNAMTGGAAAVLMAIGEAQCPQS